jgi:hypothetical protein
MSLTRYRAPICSQPSSPATPDQVRSLITRLMLPGHFFVATPVSLDTEYWSAEESAWEIFRGHLLDPAQTRERRTFEAWNLYLIEAGVRPAQPVLSVKFDPAANEVHVVRSLLVHGWEAYEESGNVILSRETTKWSRELVGTIPLTCFPTLAEMESELAGRIFQAVVGTSRLPLTSVEAPLPAFSLGELAYVYHPELPDDPRRSGPLRSFQDLIRVSLTNDLSALERIKLLEALLRTVPVDLVPWTASLLLRRWQDLGRSSAELPGLLRGLFNEVSLTPYSGFVGRILQFVRALVDQQALPVEDRVDFLSYLLRQIGRHLTAYDLVTFHHRGANYPDALVLDAVLKEYLELIETRPELFRQSGAKERQRRRALRQGCLLRRFYEGHLVPDAPTSPGENTRVLPPTHVRVPDEQILEVAKRTRRLYAHDPLTGLPRATARDVLQQSLDDLEDSDELRELGTAVFIDRPLGLGKAPGEPDQTLLFSHEAFSHSLAARRLAEVERLARENALAFDRAAAEERLKSLTVCGLPWREIHGASRRPTSLADVGRVADDFLFLRTSPSVVRDFLALFSLEGLVGASIDSVGQLKRVLIVPVDKAGKLALYDSQMQRRHEFQINLDKGYETRGGIEYPAGGLTVRSI